MREIGLVFDISRRWNIEMMDRGIIIQEIGLILHLLVNDIRVKIVLMVPSRYLLMVSLRDNTMGGKTIMNGI